MNDDNFFYGTSCLSCDEKPLLTMREIGDFELRFFFNPGEFRVTEADIKPLLTRASLRIGVSGADLSRVQFGEIIVRLNPAISDQRDAESLKQLFYEFFEKLPPISL